MKRLIVAVLFLSGTLFAQVFPPDLTVRHVTLVTATPIDFSERQQIVRSIKLWKQERAPVDDLTAAFREITQDVFQQHGYFKVQVDHFEVRIVEINPQREVIDLIAEVTPGDKYRLGNISFKDGAVLPVDQLRHQFTISDGDIFDVSKMRSGFENLGKLYLALGYISFIAVPEIEVHDADHTIAIRIEMDEGHIYHVGRLIIEGDEWRPGTKAKLLGDWKKYQGMPYSPAILREFLHEEHASPEIDASAVFQWEVINATPVWPNVDLPPYSINFHITLANPTACRPAPDEKLVRLCWLAHPDRMPSPR